MAAESLFCTMIRAGRTTYFIDIMEAKNGQRYLRITESRRRCDKSVRIAVRVFEESIEIFHQAMNDAFKAEEQLKKGVLSP